MIIFCSFDKKPCINNNEETHVKEESDDKESKRQICFVRARFAISMEIKAHDKDFMLIAIIFGWQRFTFQIIKSIIQLADEGTTTTKYPALTRQSLLILMSFVEANL